MRGLVPGEGSPPSKRLFASGKTAHVGPRSGVNSAMTSQRARIAERFGANVTLVGFLAGVDSGVNR